MKYLVQAEAIYAFSIVLNPILANMEAGQQYGPFETLDQAIDFYNGEIVESYSDEGPDVFNGGKKQYQKFFRQGGPLEWMNPLSEAEFATPNRFGHGFHEVAVRFDNIQRISDAI